MVEATSAAKVSAGVVVEILTTPTAIPVAMSVPTATPTTPSAFEEWCSGGEFKWVPEYNPTGVIDIAG